MKSNDPKWFSYRRIHLSNRQDLSTDKRRQLGIQEPNIKLDASPMVVFACASAFDSNPFLSLFGLLFQFCRKHHAGAKQWSGTKTSSASKGWRAFKINSTDFTCPAFHDALSVFHHFIAKSWIETASGNTQEDKVPATGTKTVLWALFPGETWHWNTPLWCDV